MSDHRPNQMWLYLLIVGFAGSRLIAETSPGWSRGVMIEPSGVDRTYEFSLGVVTKDSRQFSGRWLYANHDKSRAQSFEATKDRIGIVWPAVTLYVMDDSTHRWTPVGKSKTYGKKIRITVVPETEIDLFVDLDPFVPFIDKNRLGKVALSNGHIAEFELKYLRPPTSEEKVD